MTTTWNVHADAMAVIADVAAGRVNADQARARADAYGDPGDGAERIGHVAVLRLTNLITPEPSFLSVLFGGGRGLQGFRHDLRAVLADDTVSAVLVHVDSPGGRTALVQETAAEVRAAAQVKPVVAVANTLAASAAYWIASQATEFVVTPSGSVGAIGVYILHTDLSAAAEQEGVRLTYVYAGRRKIEGNPYEALGDEARAAFQAEVDEIYGFFTADVARGRGTTDQNVRATFGEGALVSAREAARLGMADRVATFEETLARVSAEYPPPATAVLAAATGRRARALDELDIAA